MRYEFIHLAGFKSSARRLGLTVDDLAAAEDTIMENAFGYPVMQGTAGLRKMRFPPQAGSSGKSGGIRVCYFVIVDPAHIYLVEAFGKNEKENLTAKDRNAFAKAITTIRASYRQTS